MKISKTLVAFLLALFLAVAGVATVSTENAQAGKKTQCKTLKAKIENERYAVKMLTGAWESQAKVVRSWQAAAENATRNYNRLKAMLQETRQKIRDIQDDKVIWGETLRDLKRKAKRQAATLKTLRRISYEVGARRDSEDAKLTEIEAQRNGHLRRLVYVKNVYREKCL